MGNALMREYEQGTQVASGGPGNAWKIYDAVKKSTKEPVSIFVLEKASLSSMTKDEAEKVLDHFRTGVKELTKLHHPSLLQLLSPLDESRGALMFASERVSMNLANVLGSRTNLEGTLPPALAALDADSGLGQIELKAGLGDLLQAINFLHGTAHLIHLGISPSEVYITPQGRWKLGGFNWVARIDPSTSLVSAPAPYSKDLSARAAAVPMQPSLPYTAPEVVSGSGKYGQAADSFSLGALIFELYHKSQLLPVAANLASYSSTIDTLNAQPMDKIPDSLRSYVKSLVSSEPGSRPVVQTMMKASFFADTLTKTLNFLDTLAQRDAMTKAQFMKGLGGVMSKFPRPLAQRRILPTLCLELVNVKLAPLILPHVLDLAADLPPETFQSTVEPSLVPLMAVKEPKQIPTQLLSAVHMLQQQLRPATWSKSGLAMVYSGFGSEHPEVQEAALRQASGIAGSMDAEQIKSFVLPRTCQLVLESPHVSVQVKGLMTLAAVVPRLGQHSLVDQLLPVLTAAVATHKQVGVLMSALGVFDAVSKAVGPALTATSVLPAVIPLLMEPTLNAKQFATFMQIVTAMLDRVQEFRKQTIAASVPNEAASISRPNSANSTSFAALVGASEPSQASPSTSQPSSTMSSPKPPSAIQISLPSQTTSPPKSSPSSARSSSTPVVGSVPPSAPAATVPSPSLASPPQRPVPTQPLAPSLTTSTTSAAPAPLPLSFMGPMTGASNGATGNVSASIPASSQSSSSRAAQPMSNIGYVNTVNTMGNMNTMGHMGHMGNANNMGNMSNIGNIGNMNNMSNMSNIGNANTMGNMGNMNNVSINPSAHPQQTAVPQAPLARSLVSPKPSLSDFTSMLHQPQQQQQQQQPPHQQPMMPLQPSNTSINPGQNKNNSNSNNLLGDFDPLG